MFMSVGAPYGLASCSRLGLFNLVDRVHPILWKANPCDPLNQEHEVRSIGRSPFLSSSVTSLSSC
jgi:hypothetical protein